MIFGAESFQEFVATSCSTVLRELLREVRASFQCYSMEIHFVLRDIVLSARSNSAICTTHCTSRGWLTVLRVLEIGLVD